MRDPTIPRKPPRNNPNNGKSGSLGMFPVPGRIEDRGGDDGLWLVSERGDRWPIAFVRGFAQGSFANLNEGVHAAPRPYKRDAAGNVLVHGDDVLIMFLDGDPKKPIVMGGWRPYASSGADQGFFPAVPSRDPDPLRIRKFGAGGHVQVEALDGGAEITIEVGGGSPGVGLRLSIDYDTRKVTVESGAGTDEPVAKGLAVVAALKTLATDLLTVAAAVPVAPPPPETTALLAELTATEVASSGPILSTLTRTE